MKDAACWNIFKKIEHILSFVSFNMKILYVWWNDFISFKIRCAFSQVAFTVCIDATLIIAFFKLEQFIVNNFMMNSRENGPTANLIDQIICFKKSYLIRFVRVLILSNWKSILDFNVTALDHHSEKAHVSRHTIGEHFLPKKNSI